MAARDHRAAYRRRVQLAQERGFDSVRQQARFERLIRSQAQLAGLPEPARQARSRALTVVRRARQDQLTVEQAAAAEGVPMAAVRWWASPALQPTRGGETLPTAADRLLRLVPLVVCGGGPTFVAVRGSRVARRAAEAFAVQWRYVNGQASADEVRRLAGLRIGSEEVEADPDALDEWARRGDLDLAEVYRGLFG